jgi:hypothetical protein
MNGVMENIDDMLMLVAEAQDLARRLAMIQQRIGNLGAPELADIGGMQILVLNEHIAGSGGGAAHGSAAASFFPWGSTLDG